MSCVGNIELNIFSLLLLAIVFGNMYRRSREYLPDQKLFLMIIITVAFVLVLDSVQWICDGTTGEILYYVNLISNSIYYIMQLFPYIFWCFYVRYQIKMDIKEAMKAKTLLLLPFSVNAVISILSCFNGWYFYIDSNNYYHRGELFWLSAVITYGYFLYSIVYLLFYMRKTERSIVISMLLFTLPPLICSAIQILHFGLALVWPGITISIIIIYLNIQKNQLYTDHLTGLYNRRILDIHLNDCLRNNTKPCRIGVIMLDIDKFKTINDSYGHMAGDQALIETANILKKSVGRKGFTARYGGDEFVVIVPACSISEVETIAKKIEKNIELFNRRGNAEFFISLSIGYDIFECGGKFSKYDVLNCIDRQMYEEKFKDRTLEVQMTIQ